MTYYGPLPKDCWSIIGNRCNVTSQVKISFTCSKLKLMFFQQFSLEKWLKIVKVAEWKGIFKSAKNGHRDLLELFISRKMVYWNAALYGAAKGGHRNLVDFVISVGGSEGSRWSIHNWKLSCYFAALGGHRDLVDFFVAKGGSLNRALEGAAQCKDATVRRGLVDYIISKGSNDGIVINWNMGLEGAVRGNHSELVNFFISKGANYEFALKCMARKQEAQDIFNIFLTNVNE